MHVNTLTFDSSVKKKKKKSNKVLHKEMKSTFEKMFDIQSHTKTQVLPVA